MSGQQDAVVTYFEYGDRRQNYDPVVAWLEKGFTIVDVITNVIPASAGLDGHLAVTVVMRNTKTFSIPQQMGQ